MKLIDLAKVHPVFSHGWLRKMAERALAVEAFNTFYRNARDGDPDLPFMKRCLDELEVDYEVEDAKHLEALMQGPCVVVANHPFGGVESLVFAHLVRQVRPDAKILVNYLLAQVPEIGPWVIGVDPFERSSSSRSNLAPMREAIQHVQGGGVLALYPAGAVSHYHWRQRMVTDPPWSLHMAAIAQRTNAPILPLFFHGQNGWLFQVLGGIHPMLRTALLFRELMNKRGRTIKLRIGKVISPKQWQRFKSKQRLTAFVRASTYLLRKPTEAALRHAAHRAAPIAESIDPSVLDDEIQSLPRRQNWQFKKGLKSISSNAVKPQV